MKRSILRRLLALALSALTVWAVAATIGADSPAAAAAAIRQANLPQKIVQWELGDVLSPTNLPFCTLLALQQSPILMAGRNLVGQSATTQTPASTTDESSDGQSTQLPTSATTELTFLDNGAPSETVIPTSAKGYTVIGNVYIKSTSVQSWDPAAIGSGTFAAALTEDAPQVLIIHTHGSEAYTMPSGQEYTASGSYRTTDARYSVIRVGDEIAAALSQYGISVLHDRALYDTQYDGAYDRSMAAIEDYLAKYPSLVFVLDVHRDAVQDSSGQQYKLISREEPHAAQISLIMGSDYDAWQENLKLAVAVQQTITEQYPTLMRPLTLRNTGYNEGATVGSLLVEVGTAGNSLDEAIYAGRLFAQGFAQTLLDAQQEADADG